MKFLCYNNQAVIEPAVRHGPGTSYGGVAQLGERTVRIRKVKGSNPSVSTNYGKSGFRLPFFHTAVCTVKF